MSNQALRSFAMSIAALVAGCAAETGTADPASSPPAESLDNGTITVDTNGTSPANWRHAWSPSDKHANRGIHSFASTPAPSPSPSPTTDPAPAPAPAPTTTPAPSPSPTTAPAPAPAPAPATTSLRGANLVGMEGGYGFDPNAGPAAGTDYPVHSTKVIDYLASKHVNVIRFLFSWERMQSTLNGPVPAATSGNYKAYFDDYDRIVEYATNTKGMTVIIEPWQASSSGGVGGPSWRGNLVGGGTVTAEHFADFWSKLAAIYAGNPRVSIGLVNEPNGIGTMVWFDAAQKAVTAIRSAGFTGEIQVPGNGWTGAGSWNDAWYDAASPQRSNAYGWMNARGAGQPLSDPLGKLAVEVHSYADTDAGGSSTGVVSPTVSRDRMKGVTDWARANGLHVFVGEIGMYASATNAEADWSDFVSYLNANGDAINGFAWWGCGAPGWWNDVAANNGGHFSITPTNDYTTDTVNMSMIAASFVP